MNPSVRCVAARVEWAGANTKNTHHAKADTATRELAQKRNNRRLTKIACFSLPENEVPTRSSGSGEFMELLIFLLAAS